MSKRFLFVALLLLLTGAGCTSTTPSTDTTESPSSSNTPSEEAKITLSETVYTSFVINTHDWTEPEESIATLNRLLDLHEKYDLPIDIYLNDPMVQLYEQEAPDLIERLKDKSYVAISYHLRPPYPYYAGFRESVFDGLSKSELRSRLLDYEEHAIDLKTGEPTDEPGGYEHLKDLLGYAPIVVAGAADQDPIHKTLASIYKEKGATFTLRHNVDDTLGSSINGLSLRPENVEVKVYERKDEISVDALFAESFAALPETRPAFLNLKWHENNFYSSGTGWFGVYFADGADRSITLDPPYDLSLGYSTQTDKTEAQKQIQWDRYEAVLAYVKARPETYTVINAWDLLDLLEQTQ